MKNPAKKFPFGKKGKKDADKDDKKGGKAARFKKFMKKGAKGKDKDCPEDGK